MAPTIRELAQKMGPDPDGREKTITRYNNVYVKNHEDEVLARLEVHLTNHIALRRRRNYRRHPWDEPSLDCFVFGQIAGENASQEIIAA